MGQILQNIDHLDSMCRYILFLYCLLESLMEVFHLERDLNDSNRAEPLEHAPPTVRSRMLLCAALQLACHKVPTTSWVLQWVPRLFTFHQLQESVSFMLGSSQHGRNRQFIGLYCFFNGTCLFLESCIH